MSIKIYNAYKVIGPNPWDVIWEIRDQGRKTVRQKIADLYRDLLNMVHGKGVSLSGYLLDSHPWGQVQARFDEDISANDTFLTRLRWVRDYVWKGFQGGGTSLERTLWNPDIYLSVYPHRSKLYVRVYDDFVSYLGGSLDFVEEHPRLEDFHYQDQCDRPDDVTAAQWRSRGRVWDAVYPDGYPRLTRVDIWSLELFQIHDPWFEVGSDLRKRYEEQGSH